MKKLSATLSFFLILLLLNSNAWSQATERYGAFSLFPQGSNRVMGMGGAFAAVADDVFAIPFNPAGLSFSEEVILFGGTQNRVVNREGRLADGFDFSQPYDFLFFAAAYNSKNFSIGMAYVSPYFLQAEEFGESTEFVVQNYEVALSYKVSKTLSLGVVGIYSENIQSLKFQGLGVDSSERANTTSWRVGMMLRGKKLGLGFAYEPAKQYSIDQSANAPLFFTYFRDVVIPAKLTMGASYQVNDKLLAVVDVDFIEPVSDAVLVGSGVFSTDIPIINQSYTVPHGGLEYQIVKGRHNEVVGRVGTYKEPTRLFGGKDRWHFTLGLEVRLGPVVLGVSFDQAEEFNNTAQGFSLSFGHL